MYILRNLILVVSMFVIAACSVNLPVMKLYAGENLPDTQVSFLELPAVPRKIQKNQVLCILHLDKYDGDFVKRKDTKDYQYALKPGEHTFVFRMTAINDVRESVAPDVPADQLRENSTERFEKSLQMAKGVHYFAEPICRNGQKNVEFIQQ